MCCSCVCVCIVPAAVLVLRVDSRNSTGTLWVSWQRADGEVSGYLAALYNPDQSQQAEQLLDPDSRGHAFSGLVPGRLYTAVVHTQSGDLSNSASTRGRTGQSSTHYVSSPGSTHYYVLYRLHLLLRPL